MNFLNISSLVRFSWLMTTPPSSFSIYQGRVAVEKSGEKVERESHGCGAAAEEEAHRLVQLHSSPTEEPAVEAAPRAGICDHRRPSSRVDCGQGLLKKGGIKIEGEWF